MFILLTVTVTSTPPIQHIFLYFSKRMPNNQSNFKALPGHWDKGQTPDTGFKVWFPNVRAFLMPFFPNPLLCNFERVYPSSFTLTLYLSSFTIRKFSSRRQHLSTKRWSSFSPVLSETYAFTRSRGFRTERFGRSFSGMPLSHMQEPHSSKSVRVFCDTSIVLCFLNRQRDLMKKSNVGNSPTEKKLFHGTDSKYIDAICHSNFDWRICGTHGTAFGKGGTGSDLSSS